MLVLPVNKFKPIQVDSPEFRIESQEQKRERSKDRKRLISN